MKKYMISCPLKKEESSHALNLIPFLYEKRKTVIFCCVELEKRRSMIEINFIYLWNKVVTVVPSDQLL